MIITSVNNERIKNLVRLKDKKYRDKTGLFFIEGLDIIEEAYKAGVLKELYVLEGYDSPYEDIATVNVTYEVMKKISDMESVSEYYGVCKKIQEKELGKKIIILDGIQDPGNLGTIIRSAVAFNIDTVVLSRECVDLYNSKVLRSTKGMIFNKNVIVRDIVPFIDSLDKYTIYGTSVTNGEDIRSIELPEYIALVIGNEGKGISQEVYDRCNKFIYIKMNDRCESLNAGVAASIIMYEVNNK